MLITVVKNILLILFGYGAFMTVTNLAAVIPVISTFIGTAQSIATTGASILSSSINMTSLAWSGGVGVFKVLRYLVSKSYKAG